MVFSLTLILVFATIFTQLFIMSQYATKGEDINQLETQKAELEEKNLILRRKIAEAKNLDYIKSQAEEDGFVAISAKEVSYLTLQNIEVK